MNEIKCPKCGTVFQINETDYESIAKEKIPTMTITK